nr:alpha/beta hydrolase [Halanaerobacter jeridensis]
MQEKVFKNAVEGGLKDIIKVKNGHYLAVGSAQGQSAVHNTHGFLIEFNVTDTQHKKLIKPPLNNSNFIDYQAQEITLDLDLLSLSNEVLTEVQLQPWTDYYQLKELAPLGSTWEQAGVPIILIHGFQAKAVTKNDYEQALKFVFGQLVKRIVQDSRIDANEVRVYGSIWPTKMYSIEKNARSLKEAINQNQDLKYRDDIIIIAHSMGGILARSYIEEFGGAQHVQRLITISTPHQGVPSTLVYNWTRSNFLQGMVNFLADNPLGFDFSGLRDTFATEYFYQLTTFQEQSKFEKRLSNTFLEQLNQNFAYYYDRGLYKLIAADAAGDENITFMYDLVADNYAGVQNDGLVATASALFSEEYSGIVKKASHAAITEDEDVIEAIIDDLDDLIYHLQLDSELLRKNEAIKVEIYKKIGEDKFRIFQKVVKDEQWSTANKIKELTLQGWIETTQLGLSGQNWVEIYVVDDAKERLITSYSINSSQAQ